MTVDYCAYDPDRDLPPHDCESFEHLQAFLTKVINFAGTASHLQCVRTVTDGDTQDSDTCNGAEAMRVGEPAFDRH